MVAVVFLAASAGVPPSIWSLALIALIPARGALKWLMNRCGHGELLLLLGFVMAIGGYGLFDVLRLKGDLGALIFGMLVAGHPKASEMANSLLSFKDLFLVGFFLSIGLSGIPTLSDLGIAFILIVLGTIKVVLYFGVLTRFRMRARTASLTSLGLANFSEFGLIIGALGVSKGWVSDQWLLIIAVAVAGTFIVASPLNTAAHRIYDRHRNKLTRFERKKRLPEEESVIFGDATVIIFGMGRLGAGAYDAMSGDFGDRLLGVDIDPDVVQQHIEDGRKVVRGDATDRDFWERAVLEGQVKVAMLALPNSRANMVAAAEIHQFKQNSSLVVTATAEYDDQLPELLDGGVDAAFNFYSEAGQGYADFVRDALALDSKT